MAKSYVRNIARYLETVSDAMGVQINGKETIVAPLDKYIAEHEHILTPEGDQQVRTLIEQLISTHHLENILHYDKVAAAALRQTDRDTYQAMEALVHNLCTLSCFPGYEKVTVFDHCLNQWITYEFEEFYHHFVKGRYSALSLNPSEGKFELKPITEIFKTYSDRKLIRITDELDHELICTEDHEFIAIDRDGNYVEATADELVSVAEAGTNFHFTMHATTISSVPIKCIEDLGKYDGAVYDLSVEDNHTFILSNGMIVKNCRSGAQVPFSSLNFGTDTSKEGRMVSKNLLLATDAGLGAGETAIFPISIFRLKKGINFDKGDPNYDLFKLACKVSARRSFPEHNWGNYVAVAA